MTIPREQKDRRRNDNELNIIQIGIARIEEQLHFQLKYYEQCAKDRDSLFNKSDMLKDRVGALETKQKTIIGIGSFLGITWLGALLRWVFNQLGR